MRALGHERYQVVGHDIGMWIAYALASDQPQAVRQLAVTEAVIPGLAPEPGIFAAPADNIFLWHFMFNQVADLPEALISGRERAYLEFMFDRWSYRRDAVAADTYIAAYSRPGALRAGFAWYRAIPEPSARTRNVRSAGWRCRCWPSAPSTPPPMRRCSPCSHMPMTCAAASCRAAAISSWKKRRRHSLHSCCRSCRRHTMQLEPALQQFVDAVASQPLPDDLRELRAISESALPQLQGAPQPVAHVIEHAVIARDGHALEVRLYTPEGLPDGPAPALLFAHGGGWFQCSLGVYDGPCRALANASGCVIVAVGYRLAPEHPFPLPLHDVADAWSWLLANAVSLGLDPQRLAIGGDSAGGNLAAACCLRLRDLGLPQPRHQLLLYPALDAGMGSDSYREYASGYYLSAELMQRCWQAYLGDLHPPLALASPAHATDLHGLRRPPCSAASTTRCGMRPNSTHGGCRRQVSTARSSGCPG